MSHDADQSTRPAGRSVNIQAFGDTADELDLAALDEARAVFGQDARLEINNDYMIHEASSVVWRGRDGGKRYTATINVRVVERP